MTTGTLLVFSRSLFFTGWSEFNIPIWMDRFGLEILFCVSSFFEKFGEKNFNIFLYSLDVKIWGKYWSGIYWL